jgi:hypothetical protein
MVQKHVAFAPEKMGPDPASYVATEHSEWRMALKI